MISILVIGHIALASFLSCLPDNFCIVEHRDSLFDVGRLELVGSLDSVEATMLEFEDSGCDADYNPLQVLFSRVQRTAEIFPLDYG